MQDVINVYHSYSGGYPYMGLFLAALLFCYILFPKERLRLIWPNILIMVIFFNPIMKKIIEEKFLGGGVYWRIWWLIPVNLIITIMVVYSIDSMTKKKEKWVISIFIISIVLLSGRFVFNTANFTVTENRFKLSDEIIEISEILEGDISNNSNEGGLIVAVYNVAWQLRMYDPELMLLFGRNPEISMGEYALPISTIVNSDMVDLIELQDLLKKDEVSYLVLTNKQIALLTENGVSPNEYGYTEIGRTQTYCVYATDFWGMRTFS